jgi:hypothetical protein
MYGYSPSRGNAPGPKIKKRVVQLPQNPKMGKGSGLKLKKYILKDEQ